MEKPLLNTKRRTEHCSAAAEQLRLLAIGDFKRDSSYRHEKAEAEKARLDQILAEKRRGYGKWRSDPPYLRRPAFAGPGGHTCRFVSTSDGTEYYTSLSACTCPAYLDHEKHHPCKHMFRLAMEPGLLE